MPRLIFDYKKFYSSKLLGKSSPRVYSSYPLDLAISILISFSQNSESAYRQTPQGGQGSEISPFFPPAIAIALNFRAPSASAVKSAVRSAQFVTENEEFSILQPIYTFPLSASRAAPTKNPE